MTPTISLIAAVDEGFGLGKANRLLCHLPADLAHFKKITMGKPIIMGRRTYESIGRALPGRLNIVLSRSTPRIDDVEVVHSLEQALELTADTDEIMIIGGADLFRQAISIASRIYLTKIHHRFDADTFFPHLHDSVWCCRESVSRQPDEKNAYAMTFYLYERC
ncbi:dihydrofolate reductase [Legionella spiritensis]|uniref:Dihydrofolate reductase n=1 Tax=Legionella spiritensis TaxID=452 RepID=A0A0W0Z8I8_LEGSP|nr:dihydrofolate reductase [Legionella spiritensis]KTD65295.1 dihydrofolate reductase FolA [Legionella spiritensis]SNV30030.1 dihydrofolate reductase [Legionella spiritensis]VEG91851.1 dihydrofolate reductase [Legionella spiritensis]